MLFELNIGWFCLLIIWICRFLEVILSNNCFLNCVSCGFCLIIFLIFVFRSFKCFCFLWWNFVWVFFEKDVVFLILMFFCLICFDCCVRFLLLFCKMLVVLFMLVLLDMEIFIGFWKWLVIFCKLFLVVDLRSYINRKNVIIVVMKLV